MKRERKTRLAPISEEVWRDLVKLSESLSSQSPPANLEAYAENVDIRHVRFRPLISDAGLMKRGEAIEVVVNTEAPGVTLPPEMTASVGDGTWAKFQPSLRFTVAHEIAHAFFIRAAKKAEAGDFLQQKENRPAVEEACKILARLMLLPRSVLIREIGDGLLNLDYVTNQVKAFEVSPEVFLRRFHLSDLKGEQGKLDGFVAFVHEKNGRLCIKAAHVLGRHAIDRFHRALQRAKLGAEQKKFEYTGLSESYIQAKWALEGMAVNDLKLDKKDFESFFRSAETGQLDLDVGWTNTEIIPCNLAFRRIHQQPLGILSRVQVLGPMQQRGQKIFF